MFTHVKCQNCGQQYNGKTGESNTRRIVIYLVVSNVLFLVLCAATVFLVVTLNSN